MEQQSQSGGSAAPIIIGLVVLVILVVGYYFYKKSTETEEAAVVTTPPPPAPVVTQPTPPPPPAASSLTPLYSTGQKIQDTELEIGLAPVPFYSAPFGYDVTKPPAYSMTMDIMVSQTADRWRNIMSHSPSTGADYPVGTTYRRPAVFVTGNDVAPANRIMLSHGNSSNEGSSITSTNTTPLGKYFTLTWVVYNGTMTMYWNGVPDPAGPISSSFNWPPTDQPWTWMQGNYTGNVAGSIKVKNVYWFNRALAQSDLQLIASQYSSSGTSSYIPEPYTAE
jgi:hypothetical protein